MALSSPRTNKVRRCSLVRAIFKTLDLIRAPCSLSHCTSCCRRCCAGAVFTWGYNINCSTIGLNGARNVSEMVKSSKTKHTPAPPFVNNFFLILAARCAFRRRSAVRDRRTGFCVSCVSCPLTDAALTCVSRRSVGSVRCACAALRARGEILPIPPTSPPRRPALLRLAMKCSPSLVACDR